MKKALWACALCLLACALLCAPALAGEIENSITQITLSKSALLLKPGASSTLAARLKPSSSQEDVLWISSDPEVASVSQTGRVTAKNTGKAEITVRSISGGAEATCTVHVRNVRVTQVKLNRSTATVALFGSVKLSASVKPLSADERSVTWKSSDERVATVDDAGTVTTHAAGTATITCRATDGSGKKASCKVTVKTVRVTSIKLGESAVTLNKGESHTISSVKVSPANASYPQVEWISEDTSVATVDENGKITAVGPGVTRVIASTDLDKKKAACTVRVRGAETVFTISAMGDVVLGGDKQYHPNIDSKFPLKEDRVSSYARFQRYYKAYGPDYFFKNVRDILAADDISVINFESTFYNSTRKMREDKTFAFSAPPSYVNILSGASIEAATLANNHTYDFGTAGYESTRKTLKSAGITANGFNTQTATRTVNGVKVGFCGFQTPTPLSTIRSVVSKLNKSCDIVIAQFHWGNGQEWKANVTTYMRQRARAAVNAGADLVLGHHRHLVSGIEKYQGKYIVYDLGNFVAGVRIEKYPSESDKVGMIFQQTFKVFEDGYVEDGGITIIPTSHSSTENTLDWQPCVLTGSAKNAVIEKIKSLSIGWDTFLFK